MKFAICNETYQGWEWEATCASVAEAGYDGIELAPFTFAEHVTSLDGVARAEIRSVAERAGLEIVGLHWLLVSPKGLSITSDDPAVRETTRNYLRDLVGLCRDVGGSVMVLGSPAQRRLPGEGQWGTAVERLTECLLPALDAAGEAGITLCLEPLPRPEADFVLTLAEAEHILARIQHPALKTILDIKSASSEGIPIPDLAVQYAPLIAHVHANDSNRRGPGFGDVDFKPILSALTSIGYRGYVSVEVFDYTPDPVTIARNSLEYLRTSLAG
jgi:sugar phosphate isomerase/epimerase